MTQRTRAKGNSSSEVNHRKLNVIIKNIRPTQMHGLIQILKLKRKFLFCISSKLKPSLFSSSTIYTLTDNDNKNFRTISSTWGFSDKNKRVGSLRASTSTSWKIYKQITQGGSFLTLDNPKRISKKEGEYYYLKFNKIVTKKKKNSPQRIPKPRQNIKVYPK